MKRGSWMLIGGAVLAVGTAVAHRTSTVRDMPIYNNGGKPDLTPDPQRFVSQMEIVDRYISPDDCSVQEGSVTGTGYRRLLRFDLVQMNRGDGDLYVGNPTDPNNPYRGFFEFAPCHGHYHFKDATRYVLLNLDGTEAAMGHKQSFCYEDSLRYDSNRSNGYTCGNQGITSGWGDWYYKQLPGQWIDITGVPEGDYIVRITVNYSGMIDEGQNRYPNTLEEQIHVPDPRNKVTVDDSAYPACETTCQ